MGIPHRLPQRKHLRYVPKSRSLPSTTPRRLQVLVTPSSRGTGGDIGHLLQSLSTREIYFFTHRLWNSLQNISGSSNISLAKYSDVLDHSRSQKSKYSRQRLFAGKQKSSSKISSTNFSPSTISTSSSTRKDTKDRSKRTSKNSSQINSLSSIQKKNSSTKSSRQKRHTSKTPNASDSSHSKTSDSTNTSTIRDEKRRQTQSRSWFPTPSSTSTWSTKTISTSSQSSQTIEHIRDINSSKHDANSSEKIQETPSSCSTKRQSNSTTQNSTRIQITIYHNPLDMVRPRIKPTPELNQAAIREWGRQNPDWTSPQFKTKPFNPEPLFALGLAIHKKKHKI